jgi:hypothetical protein
VPRRRKPSLQINVLGGNDSVNVTQTGTNPIGVHVDLGASQA